MENDIFRSVGLSLYDCWLIVVTTLFLTLPVLILFTYSSDATIFLRDNATEVLEGAGTGSVEVCIILEGLPSGGLDCNITVELATTNITASKWYCHSWTRWVVLLLVNCSLHLWQPALCDKAGSERSTIIVKYPSLQDERNKSIVASLNCLN